MRKKIKSPIIKIIYLLIILLVISFYLPELRVGPKGFIYPPPTIGTGERVGLPWAFEIIIVFMFGFFVLGFLNREIKISDLWFNKFIFVLGIIALIEIPLSKLFDLREGPASSSHLRFTLESICLFFILANLNYTKKFLKYIINLFIGAALFNALISIFTFYFPELIPFFTNIIPQGQFFQISGLFSQPSRQSLLLSLGFIMTFFIFLTKRIRSLKQIFTNMGLILILIIFSIAIAFAQIRTSYVSIPSAFITSWLIFRKKLDFGFKKGYLIFLLFLIIIFVGETMEIAPIALNRFLRIGLFDEFNETRGLVWPISMKILLLYPLGTGYDALGNLSQEKYGIYITHAHNLFLHWGIMFGFPGLIFLIYTILRIFKEMRLLFASNYEVSIILIPIISANILFIFSGMTEPFFVTNSGLYFWMFSGFMASFIREIKIEEK